MIEINASERALAAQFEKTFVKLGALDARAGTSWKAKEQGDELLAGLLVTLGLKTDRSWQTAPLSTDLTELQRAVVLSLHGLQHLSWYPLPSRPLQRLRWLGLDPPGALETRVEITLRGVQRAEPMWRALNLLRDLQNEEGGDVGALDAFVAALPAARRLAIVEEADFTSETDPYGISGWLIQDLWRPDDASLRALDSDLLPWAGEVAERWSVRTSPRMRDSVSVAVFSVLVAGGKELSPAWDDHIPCFCDELSDEWVDHILAALPPERRIVQLRRLLGEHFAPGMILERGLRHFEAMPDPALYKLLKKQFAEYGSAKHKKGLVTLESLAKAALKRVPAPRARKLPDGVLAFHDTLTATSPLTAVQKEQVIAAGKAYFGAKRSFSRLLSESAEEGDSFFDNIVLFTVGGGGATALDYVYVMGDSGLIFRSGTTEMVGQIVQDGVQATAEVPEAELEQGFKRGRR